MREVPAIGRFVQRLSRSLFCCALGLALVSLGGCTEERRPDAAGGQGVLKRTQSAPLESCEDGEVRTCSLTVDQDAEQIHCLNGTQECRDGYWTRCGEIGAALISHHPRPQRELGVDKTPQALSSPSDSVGNCDADPCAVGCMGFDEVPTIPIHDPGSVIIFANASEWGNGPTGFINKQNCNTCGAGYPKNCNGTPQHRNMFDGCLADHHCNTTTGQCNRNGAGWTWPAATCPGVDLTLTPYCTRYEESVYIDEGFSVCNRGNAPLAAGSVIKIAVRNGDWLNFTPSSVSVTGAQFCNKTLTTALAPGSCERVTIADCPLTGNAVAYVNYDGSIPECGYPEPAALGTATAPGRSNNWSDVKPGSNACITLTAADTLIPMEDYVAECGDNETPVWDLLTFDTVIPCSPGACDGTNAGWVAFEAQTAWSDDVIGTISAPIAVAVAPNTQAAVCSLTGPSPNCPVNLKTALGSPLNTRDLLRLTITLAPSPDKQVAPSLNNWQVTYRCIPWD